MRSGGSECVDADAAAAGVGGANWGGASAAACELDFFSDNWATAALTAVVVVAASLVAVVVVELMWLAIGVVRVYVTAAVILSRGCVAGAIVL